ncbi:unnamed protein product, partial [Mesorhabditis spiculigera]
MVSLRAPMLLQLPDEVLEYIGAYLTHEDKLQLSRSCQKLHGAVRRWKKWAIYMIIERRPALITVRYNTGAQGNIWTTKNYKIRTLEEYDRRPRDFRCLSFARDLREFLTNAELSSAKGLAFNDIADWRGINCKIDELVDPVAEWPQLFIMAKALRTKNIFFNETRLIPLQFLRDVQECQLEQVTTTIKQNELGSALQFPFKRLYLNLEGPFSDNYGSNELWDIIWSWYNGARDFEVIMILFIDATRNFLEEIMNTIWVQSEDRQLTFQSGFSEQTRFVERLVLKRRDTGEGLALIRNINEITLINCDYDFRRNREPDTYEKLQNYVREMEFTRISEMRESGWVTLAPDLVGSGYDAVTRCPIYGPKPNPVPRLEKLVYDYAQLTRDVPMNERRIDMYWGDGEFSDPWASMGYYGSWDDKAIKDLDMRFEAAVLALKKRGINI